MDTTDAKGNRGVTTGNTPAAGMIALAAATSPKKSREVPKLALVTSDYDPDESGFGDDGIQNLSTIEPPSDNIEAAIPLTTAERIRQARKQSSFLNSKTGRIVILVAGLLLLVAIVGGGFLLTKGQTPEQSSSVLPMAGTSSSTIPVPTPTGFGDATTTPLATAATPAASAGVIAADGWVKVQANGNLIMRDSPSKGGTRLASLSDGTTGRVIEGPTEADGITWWKLDVQDEGQGWCAGQFLIPISAP